MRGVFDVSKGFDEYILDGKKDNAQKRLFVRGRKKKRKEET